MQELLSLLQAAGHTGFRDARGPMGFSQRQGTGKFTRDEAAAFIDLLSEPAPGDPPADLPPEPAGAEPTKAGPPADPAAELALRRVPAAQLAAELHRRGWIVIEP